MSIINIPLPSGETTRSINYIFSSRIEKKTYKHSLNLNPWEVGHWIKSLRMFSDCLVNFFQFSDRLLNDLNLESTYKKTVTKTPTTRRGSEVMRIQTNEKLE